MITNTSLIERLLRYVKIDTQSDEEAASQPSTDKQHTLARLLYKELSEMGVRAYYDIEHCYVYAKLPGEEPAIGFVSHIDTSPACSGTAGHRQSGSLKYVSTLNCGSSVYFAMHLTP